MSELGVPYVLMHMRGDPTTMQQPQHVSYPGGVWREVGPLHLPLPLWSWSAVEQPYARSLLDAPSP